MTESARQLYSSALQLTDSERADSAAWLIESLDSQDDNEVDAAWAREIRRRIESIDNGNAKLVPWNNVMRDGAHG